ncbi:MAG: hypothetical protein KC410_03720 [Anaerolineales bacterium]|uniref:hypothetical protein n=1 Tax=Promineifilum sp. TaxID=2664178 RepID=UPI001D567C2F|nr:hypothetical protein [Anaerolineales bacterium]MCB8935758.1 hypothetical protein [Promineifilum sp.]MCO5179559.1 hypothetical protein [Promineifilum sp.]
MAPLVYYCRWRGARLQLQGRDGHQVWGWLALSQQEGGRIPFRFNTNTWELTLGAGEHVEQWQLDEMGVVVPADS